MHTYSGLKTQSMIMDFLIKMNYIGGKKYQGELS